MDNPAEGENRQTSQSWPNHQPVMPAQLVSAPPPTPVAADPPGNAAPSGVVDQPHTSLASTLILQWLTYAFWGWTVLTLSALTTSVFLRLIAGQNVSNFNYYVIAALIVLLPISFICDTIYSKNEPDKKVGPSSLVMVIHAVIFALFTIGSLLFAAWSIVSLATNNVDRGTTVAHLISALIISVFFAATFMRTLNPAHIRWIPKVYRLMLLGVIILFVILGFVKPTFHNTAATDKASNGEQLNTKGTRRPSQYLHICNTSSNITYVSQGSPKCLGNDTYQSDYDSSVPGLLYSSPCKTTSRTLRYVYIAENENCPANTKLVFYNTVCPKDAISSDECTGQSDPSISPSTPSNNFGSNGKLEPSVVGGTQCDIPTLSDGSTTGQVAIAGGATCDEAEANIQSATGKNGGNYTASGYSCTSTRQGSNTQWSSYWNDDFYSYNCTSGSKQVAFNLQTTDQSKSASTLPG